MSTNPDIVGALKDAALFKNFTDTGLQIIASITHEKRVPAGAPLFVENMIGDGLYIVASGRVRLSVRGPKGEELVLGTLGPGDSLGEAALLRTGPRLCSATAEVASVVLEISRRELAVLQRAKPQAVLKLMMGVVERIGDGMRDTQDDLRELLSWRLHS
jgi:CRP/FNR family cyclic AMP-dependent transcriptional regulator